MRLLTWIFVAALALPAVGAVDLAPLAERDHATITALHLPGAGPVDLELKRFSLFDASTRFVVVGPEGERELPAPQIRFFRGHVVGDATSRVTLTLFEGELSGEIRSHGQLFRLDRGRATVGPELPMSCQDHDHRVSTALRAEAPASRGVDGSTLLVAPIAIDTTVEWFNRFDTIPSTQAYTLNLIAVASTLLEDEIGLQLTVPFLRIFEAEPDPYTDFSQSTVQLLDELKAEWDANQQEVDRAAVHLFSFRPLSAAGRAYIGGLCDHDDSPGDSLDYGVSTVPTISSPFESYLFAHELAHNIGSPHTQCYLPPIDTCATESGCWQGATTQVLGTLMSNCNQFNAEFHPRVKDEVLRPSIEGSVGSCLFEAAAPGALDALRVDRGGATGYELSWGPPCNASNVPGQDYAVYSGSLGAFATYESESCSTAGAASWSVPAASIDRFFLVVASTPSDEGSYGRDGTGQERAPAAAACKSQAIAYCAP